MVTSGRRQEGGETGAKKEGGRRMEDGESEEGDGERREVRSEDRR